MEREKKEEEEEEWKKKERKSQRKEEVFIGRSRSERVNYVLHSDLVQLNHFQKLSWLAFTQETGSLTPPSAVPHARTVDEDHPHVDLHTLGNPV